ncbi:hypothetical protein BDB01DRAFT_836585 [Pilobolus umbonatus]|nr:hypothetical protein BDB01DRAFT_836585 [Pilobolus umbonatus]
MDTTDHLGVEKKKRVEKDACLSPKTKLPETFSESDTKTAQNASNELKTLTKPIATLAAAGGSMASLLKNETYHELNDLHLKKANSDWLTNQEARCAVSQMLAGCILLDRTKVILSTVLSLTEEKSGLIPITKDIQRMIAIHPFQTRTVFKSKPVSNSLNLITQTSLSSSTFKLVYLYHPYTIWTLHDYDLAQTMDSQARRGSLIFQKIASNVHDSIKNNVDSFIEKKALENYQDDGGKLAATVKEIL